MPFLGQITGFGIPRAVVALPSLSEDQLAQLTITTVNVISGSLCFVLGVILANPLATFFKVPPLAPVVMVSCSGWVMFALMGVPTALLAKEMRFRLLSGSRLHFAACLLHRDRASRASTRQKSQPHKNSSAATERLNTLRLIFSEF